MDYFIKLCISGVILLLIAIAFKLLHKSDINNSKSNINNAEYISYNMSDNDKLIDAINRNTKAIEEQNDRISNQSYAICFTLIFIAIGICIFLFYFPELKLNQYLNEINNKLSQYQ